MAANQTIDISFSFDVTDGQHTITTSASFTVQGSNDAAMISGATTGSVTEDASLTTTGQLAVQDVDTGDSSFAAITTPLAGGYGSLVMDASGARTYTLNNSAAAVQALNAGQSLVDTRKIHSHDGTATEYRLYGLGGNDKLNGNGGADLLDGGAGADSLYGGAGNDRVVYDASDRVVDGGSGIDTLLISTAITAYLGASDQVAGGSSTVTGFENIDASAALAAVLLTGSSAANSLIGGAADDFLTGKGGADMLTGGAGADHFIFTATSESTVLAADTITDFTAGQDVIDLSAIDAIRGGANNAFSFIGGAAFTAAGQLRYDASTGALEADTNGDHIADLHNNLHNTPMLQATDFIL